MLELKEIIGSFLEGEGIDLVDLNLYRTNRKIIVRILADKPEGGITIDECAMLNNKIGNLLDEGNIIEDSYTLEVSSPGLDRPLLLVKDYKRAIGRQIKIITAVPVENKMQLQGTLVSVNDNSIDIRIDAKQISINLDNIRDAKQVI